MSRSLFLLKRRGDYDYDPSYGASYQAATGMWNSAVFVKDMLVANGQEADVQMVIDANGIDAAVTAYNPDFVFLEGIWVTKAKMQELLAIPRHTNRTWVVRVHSEIPFLATEGSAMERIADYLDVGITVAANAPRAHQQLQHYASQQGMSPTQIEQQLVMLPNSYPLTFDTITGLDTSAKAELDIAAFGALRPLKNHLQQVFIASRFAQSLGKGLRFHINIRVDQGGAPVIKNIREALAEMGHTLVEHTWEERSIFLQSLRDCDLLLQTSMSETFNITAADATYVGRPMLVSSEISWAYPLYGDPQSVDQCLNVLNVLWANKPFFIQRNRDGLRSYVTDSTARWLRYV